MSPPRAHKHCQSCSMPLKRDKLGGGTNADGSRSAVYCSRCWSQGRFTLPDITVEQMQDLVKSKLKELGFPGFVAAWLTRGIPRLERWRRPEGS